MKINIICLIIIIHNNNDNNWKNTVKNNILKYIKMNILFLYNIKIFYIKKKKPKLIEIIKNFINLKCKIFLLIPMFIMWGNHLKKEIIKEMKNILNIYTEIKIFYTKNLGKYKFFTKILNIFFIKKLNLVSKLIK